MTAQIRIPCVTICFAIALVVCALPAAFSQTSAQPPSLSLRQPESGQRTLVPPVRTFRLRPRIGVLAEARISLQEALAMALANNKDIESSRIDQAEAEYTLMGARGVFDPVASANSFWEKQVSPIASALGGSATGAVLNKSGTAIRFSPETSPGSAAASAPTFPTSGLIRTIRS